MSTLTQPMQFTYREVVVTYVPEKDWWMCEMFSRGAETPAKAQARIDELLDKQKLKPAEKFKRFEVWKTDRWEGTGFVKVTVTSLVEDDQAWITSEKGNREKVSCCHLYPINSKNDALITELNELTVARKALSKKETALKEKLQSLIAP